MRPLEYPLLLDENIHPAVASGLVALGCDVVTVASRDAAGATDEEVLAIANAEGRVVVTHDSDFGTLTVRGGRDVVGIIYLRPGHINPGIVLQMLAVVNEVDAVAEPPFIVVAERKEREVRVRLRQIQATPKQ